MSQFSRQVHGPSETKGSGNGKRKIKFKDKRRSNAGNYFSATKLAAKDVREKVRRRGGSKTVKLKASKSVSVLTKEGYKKLEIKGVLESKDNRNFARQNIITKGTIINTDMGKAVVINRPGREGTVIAKLLS
ncbi:MAG: 30S ribosomal protein S8e [Candidatus Marsarchaeota archaeon]|nr:30S ribosomal protein S8e [Candidatus Marsarchaeota archaeon]MCL5101867.1 30S ribosomal protein S8e [Candidatus Marsarchaeota archaeon]